MDTVDLMASMVGIKVVVAENAVYCSKDGIAVTVGYKFTGGDIAKAIEIAVEKISGEKQ